MIDSSIVIDSRKKRDDLGKMCIAYGLDEADLFPYIHEYKLDKTQLFSEKTRKAIKPNKKSVDAVQNLFRKRVYREYE